MCLSSTSNEASRPWPHYHDGILRYQNAYRYGHVDTEGRRPTVKHYGAVAGIGDHGGLREANASVRGMKR